MTQGDDPDNPIYVYDDRVRFELIETNRLLRSLESKFSFLFWWSMTGVFLFCVFFGFIAYAIYSGFNTGIVPPEF
jgi:hypothetical protein